MHNLFVYKEKLTCVLIDYQRLTDVIDSCVDFHGTKNQRRLVTMRLCIRYVGNLQMDSMSHAQHWEVNYNAITGAS